MIYNISHLISTLILLKLIGYYIYNFFKRLNSSIPSLTSSLAHHHYSRSYY